MLPCLNRLRPRRGLSVGCESRRIQMVELGKRAVKNFLEHRMPTYAEQLSYRGLFGLFPFIILVFALLAVLQLDVVFDRLIEAAMGAPPQQIPEPLEPVAEEGRAQAEF